MGKQRDRYKNITNYKKYLSTHKESKCFKNMGDKYGRIIQGWNNERQEPIICYAMYPLMPHSMKHNINGIPTNYYMGNNNKTNYNNESEDFLNEFMYRF